MESSYNVYGLSTALLLVKLHLHLLLEFCANIYDKSFTLDL